jgi:predicted secreted Zn-dependent protease
VAPIASASPAATTETLPDAPPETTGPAPRSDRPVSVPDGRIPIVGVDGVHYFHVRGGTHEQLTRHLRAQVRRFCGRGDVLACVRPREWQFAVQTSGDAGSVDCRISGVTVLTSYLAHVPRWVAPRRVPAPLAWWWRQVARRIAWEQAQVAQIYRDYVAALSPAVVGLSCSRFDAALRSWNDALDEDLAAFERTQAPRRQQVLRAWLREASRA